MQNTSQIMIAGAVLKTFSCFDVQMLGNTWLVPKLARSRMNPSSSPQVLKLDG